MKHFILSLFMCIFTLTVNAQNFVAPQKERVAYTDTTTTYTYEIKETKYKVFRSKMVLTIFGRKVPRLVRTINTIFLKKYKLKWEEDMKINSL